MHRTDGNGNVANQFNPGDPAVPRLPTQIDDPWLNAVQEEIANTIESDGTALVKGEWFQLRGVLALLLPAPGGRLTLSTGVPVTTSDVSGATTVYYTPYKHNRISVYDGTRWRFYSFAEMSQTLADATKSPAAAVASSNYDVFVWSDAGTLRATRGPAWTSDTARGGGAGTTELELFGGKWTNKNAITNGPAAHCGLYVGTIRVDGSTQVNDAFVKRHVWNCYNRVPRGMARQDTSAWVYSSGVTRQANANAANQLDLVRGLDEDSVTAQVFGLAQSTDAGVSGGAAVGLGLDSTTAGVTGSINGGGFLVQNVYAPSFSRWEGLPGLGRHYLVWLETGVGAPYTSSFFASGAGIQAQVLA